MSNDRLMGKKISDCFKILAYLVATFGIRQLAKVESFYHL